MGFIKDINDTIDEIGKIDVIKRTSSKYSSIAKQASEGVCYCPILVSDSNDIEILQSVVKALERNYASFLMVAMSLNPTMEYKGGTGDVVQYIKQFHQNTGELRRDKFDFLRAADGFGLENYDVLGTTDNGDTIIGGIYESCGTPKMLKDIQFNNNGGFMGGLNLGILNDCYTRTVESTMNEGRRTVDLESYYDSDEELVEEEKLFEMPVNAFTKRSMQSMFGPVAEAKGGSSSTIGGNESSSTSSSTNGGSTGSSNDKDKRKSKPRRDTSKKREKKVITSASFANNLQDNDVKKSNELVPTTIHIKVGMVGKGGDLLKTVDFLIGVKAHMHLVKRDEMITNLLYAVKKKGNLFKFIQWTSGEISFFKDFLLDLDTVRQDAVNDTSKSADWHWAALKRRKTFSKSLFSLFKKTNIMPNTTIVISKDEADYISTKFGFDLMNPEVANKIIKEYFLLAFVIIDNATQIVYFLYEGYRDYEAITLSSLERENSNDSKKFKEMLKVINRN